MGDRRPLPGSSNVQRVWWMRRAADRRMNASHCQACDHLDVCLLPVGVARPSRLAGGTQTYAMSAGGCWDGHASP